MSAPPTVCVTCEQPIHEVRYALGARWKHDHGNDAYSWHEPFPKAVRS